MSPANWLKNVLRSDDQQGSAVLGPGRTLLGFQHTPGKEGCGDNNLPCLWGCVPGRAEDSGSWRDVLSFVPVELKVWWGAEMHRVPLITNALQLS